MQRPCPAPRPALVATLLAAPALLFVVVWVAFQSVKGPYWLGSNLDPDYPYLLNGLSILSGNAPGHVDHPGTPVQVLVAGTIAVVHACTGSAPLVDDVLGRPEHYLSAANRVLFALLALALAWAGLATWRATRSVAATLVVQAVPALASRSLSQVACVKPEPLLLALVAALVAATMGALASERRPGPARAALLGALVGVAACTKITAAPLILLPWLLLRRTADRAVLAGAAAGAFVVSLSPALGRLGAFGGFLERIATHSGQYGAGAPALFDPSQYASGLAQAAGRNPDLVAAMVAGAVTWALARRRAELRSDGWVRALGGAVAAQLAIVLLVARHPGLHYVLPATALSGFTIAGVLRIGPQVLAGSWRRPAAAVAIALSAFLALREMAQGLSRYRGFAAARTEQLAAAAAAQAVPGATVVYYYRASAPVFALRFGDELSAGRWTAWLDAHHPGAVFFNPFVGSFGSYGPPGLVPPPAGRPLLFQGSTLGLEPFTAAMAHHGLTPVFSGRYESVYRAPSTW